MTRRYIPEGRPAVMGILNVTPDSFSDGGRYAAREAAIAQARRMIGEGADILDIGGESTRPGSDPVSEDDELERVIPVIEAVRGGSDIPISIDTMKPRVARAAVAAGANIWNDVTALRHDENSLAAAAELGVPVILMHMRGAPKTMQDVLAPYGDVARDVRKFLKRRAGEAAEAGVDPDNIWLDPGIGFGKSVEDNLRLTRRLSRLVSLGYPVLYAASRKRFIASVAESAQEADSRLPGSLAAALFAVSRGAQIVRVHDVAETVQALRLWTAIDGASR